MKSEYHKVEMYVFIILLSYMDFEQRSHLSIIYYVLCVCQPQKIIFMKHVSFSVAHVLYYNTDPVIMSTIILKFYVNYM